MIGIIELLQMYRLYCFVGFIPVYEIRKLPEMTFNFLAQVVLETVDLQILSPKLR